MAVSESRNATGTQLLEALLECADPLRQFRVSLVPPSKSFDSNVVRPIEMKNRVTEIANALGTIHVLKESG